jgi:hypothetical protein
VKRHLVAALAAAPAESTTLLLDPPEEGLERESYLERRKRILDALTRAGLRVGAFQSLEAGRKSNVSCACHWTVAVAASKEVIVRQAMKELNEAHEAGARSNYAAWMKKVQQDMEGARAHVLKQGKEVSERLDGMAVSTIERVQRNMEATRSEAVDRFVTRLRDQVVPMLAEAKESMHKLEASGTAFKNQSQAIHADFEGQLELSANSSLARTQEELEKKSIAIASAANDTLLNFYQKFERAARENVEALLGSVGSQMTRILEEKAAEVSREFAAGLEGYTRSYLESIGKSIAQIPMNMNSR